jgi:hypothetical protein
MPLTMMIRYGLDAPDDGRERLGQGLGWGDGEPWRSGALVETAVDDLMNGLGRVRSAGSDRSR